MVYYHIAIWYHNPEDLDLNLHCCENPKCCNITRMSGHKLVHILLQFLSYQINSSVSKCPKSLAELLYMYTIAAIQHVNSSDFHPVTFQSCKYI